MTTQFREESPRFHVGNLRGFKQNRYADTDKTFVSNIDGKVHSFISVN